MSDFPVAAFGAFGTACGKATPVSGSTTSTTLVVGERCGGTGDGAAASARTTYFAREPARTRFPEFFAATLAAISFSACSPTWIPHSDPNEVVDTDLAERRELTMAGELIPIPRRGSVTLIDVWSTSCAPCLRAMPELEALWKAHKGEALLVVGVAVDDNPGLVASKVRELGVTYPVVMDPDGAIRGSLRVAELPGALVVGRAGRVRVFRQGAEADDQRELREAVEALLAEAAR